MRHVLAVLGVAISVAAGVSVIPGTIPSLFAQGARRPYAAVGYGGNYFHNYLIPPAPSSAPFAPAVSPDGLRVAFSLHGSIWVQPLAEATATEVAASAAKYLSAPAWSPDGRWIVFTADDGGKTIELEILELATGRVAPLTTDGRAFLEPSFSPDGTRLAYVASQPNGFLNVFVRGIREGAWTGDPIAITEDSTTEIATERPYFTPRDMALSPAWINDRELAMVSNHQVPLGSGRIVRVPAEALGIRRATVIVDEQTLYHARPAISADGRTMAYVSSRGGRQARHELVFHDLRNGSSRRVSPGAFDLFRPAWTPDGARVLCVSNERSVPELTVVDAASGRVTRRATPALRYRSARGHVVVRVRDAATKATLPARVHVTGADGRFYAPTGSFARVSWAGDRVFHTAGTFELDVPPGSTRLQVVRGFEFIPAAVTVDVTPGGRHDVEVVLMRLDDQAARGWRGGSTGAHVEAGGLLLDTPAALVSMAEAEDVAIVSSPIPREPRELTAADFWILGGSAHPSSSPSSQLVLGQEHRPPFFGHVMAFGMGRLLDGLIPVTIGYEAAAGASLGRSNTDVLREMRARDGITSYVHAFSGEPDPMQAGLGVGKAFMVDAALGLVDTLEWAAASRGSFAPWYAALNNGVRVAAIGGEDSITNLHISRLMGCVRTYVHLGDDALTPTRWWQAARAGRSFVTTGPLIDLRVDDRAPGSEVTVRAAAEGARGVQVTVRVRSITPLQRVELVMNGQPVQAIPLDGSRTSVDWNGRVPVERSGWIHLRAEGRPAERGPLDTLYAQAFTNPVWLNVDGRPPRDHASAQYALQWIDRLQIMADAWPGWTSKEERAHVFGQFDEARAVYRRFADEAQPPASRVEGGGAR